MQQDYTIARERNAMFGSGILKVYFDAFSSKKRRGTTPANIYEQFCYADFVHFTFTGKERDEETGYGYFGARYMDYELTTMWLSVDPMADKYPSISPYAYCAWNPVKLVDPDGMEAIDDWVKNKRTGLYEWNDNATSPENTPNGYSYVGNDDALLEDLNIRTNYETQQKCRVGVSPDKGDNYGRIGPSGANKSTVTIRVSVCSRYDENNITSDNPSGKTFDGINVTGYVNQWSRNLANEPDGMVFNGYLLVNGSNNFQRQDRFRMPSGEVVYETGTTPMTASVHVPASYVYGNILQRATINLGHATAATTNGTMTFSWSLLKRPVIY
jgi:RHS repeat-associated protein